MEDFYYEDSIGKDLDIKDVELKLSRKQNILDQIRLISVYKGKAVPSIFFDSIGTKKIAALASIKEKYSKGEFGAIPDPDLISTLLEVDMNEEV